MQMHMQYFLSCIRYDMCLFVEGCRGEEMGVENNTQKCSDSFGKQLL